MKKRVKKSDPRTTASGDTGVTRLIERAKHELEQMIDMNPQVMLLVDRRGVVTRANRALFALLGIADFKEVLGRTLEDLFHPVRRTFFRRLVQKQEGYEARETEVVLSGNNRRTLEFTVVGSREQAGLCVLIVRDVTVEKKQAASLAKKHKQEAAQALAGAMMHSANQPLTVILTRAHLMKLALERGAFDQEEVRVDLEDIMTLAMQVADIIKQVENPDDFVTIPYVGNIDILDIDRSVSESPARGTARHMNILNVMMMAVDAHSPGFFDHAILTRRCSAILASRAGFSEEDVKIASQAGFFHDIGKLFIPDQLLMKPMALTESEFAIVRKHAQAGHALLGNFPFLAQEAEAAYSHHERYDGTGYPRRIKGAQITPITAIVAIADVYCAMRTDRCYSKALPLAVALEEIRSLSGRQLVPDYVDVFESCVSEIEDALLDKGTVD